MNKPIIATPTEFFNQVIALNDKLAIHQACNALLDLFVENFTVATISKKLTAYKKPFYTYQHVNTELNETIEIKNGTTCQHIAARLLTLSDEQKQALGVDRNERDNARAGFDADGDIREVEKPPIDITAVVKKSLECLNSNDPHTIAAGIVNLTGLRANEQNMPIRKYPEWHLIERDMVVVDEFVIGFKGISKKQSFEATNAYHARATLAPAQMIVDAQNRFKASKSVQAIGADYEKYRKGFMDTFCDRYSELFGRALSTLEAYNDDGKLTDANGTPHKGRAFYACALRSILKSAKHFNDSASNKYIQLCLAHENPSETIKYLGRYDEKDFINPIDINVPTNINGLGKMITAVAPTKTVTPKKIPAKTATPTKTPKDNKPAKNTFDVDAFITGLDADLQVKFGELMNSESSLTDAVIALINTAKKSSDTSSVKSKRANVSDEVAIIVKAIMVYNHEQKTTTDRIVPTFALIDKISQKHFDKSMAKKTIDAWLEANTSELHPLLEAMEIPGGIYNSKWNGTHHRKDMDAVIAKIDLILNKE